MQATTCEYGSRCCVAGWDRKPLNRSKRCMASAISSTFRRVSRARDSPCSEIAHLQKTLRCRRERVSTLAREVDPLRNRYACASAMPRGDPFNPQGVQFLLDCEVEMAAGSSPSRSYQVRKARVRRLVRNMSSILTKLRVQRRFDTALRRPPLAVER